jgi:diguanylate cyclase (GGDEF)-like protein
VSWRGRVWPSIYVVRAVTLLAFAVGTWLITRQWGLPVYALAVAFPYNALCARFHQRHDRPHAFVALDQVIAAAALFVDPRALPALLVVQLQSSVVGPLGAGLRSTRVAIVVATAVAVTAGIGHGDTASIVFGVVSGASALALSNLVAVVDRLRRRGERRVNGLLEGIDVFVYEADVATGNVLFSNQRADALLGIDTLRNVHELAAMITDGQDEARRHFSEAARSGTPTSAMLRLATAHGERVVEHRTTFERAHNGRMRSRNVVFDLTEQVRLREQLAHQALHDGLTGLPNRTLLADRLRHALASVERTGRPLALMMCDLDGFKEVNDAHGHHVGDLLLTAVAGRLNAQVRDVDTVARIGGDEFAVLLAESDESAASRVAQRVVDALAEPYSLGGQQLVVPGSIGFAVTSDVGHGADPALLGVVLQRAADAAMYQAKANRLGWSMAPMARPADHGAGRTTGMT